MKASEYPFQKIFDEADMLTTELEAKTYGSWEEAKRDRARALELWQRYIDLLGEAMDDPEALKPDKWNLKT